MKRFLQMTSFVAFMTFSGNVFACEICGCGNNNFQIGILPTFSKGFFGIRYSTSTYHSRLALDASQFSHDYYRVAEVWGGYNFKKFQVMAFLPYLYSKKISDDGTTVANGMGDLMALLNYRAFSSSLLNKRETTTIKNDVFIGAGIKLPTGLNRIDVRDQDFNMGDFNSQPGTGSVDFLLNVTHNIAWNRSGVVTNAAYRMNTNNRDDYRFGNRTYFATAYYYTISAKMLKIKPSTGVSYQSNTANTFAGAVMEGSNGYTLSSTVGFNFLCKKIGFNAMAFVPIKQQMYQGQTSLSIRTTFGFTYSI